MASAVAGRDLPEAGEGQRHVERALPLPVDGAPSDVGPTSGLPVATTAWSIPSGMSTVLAVPPEVGAAVAPIDNEHPSPVARDVVGPSDPAPTPEPEVVPVPDAVPVEPTVPQGPLGVRNGGFTVFGHPRTVVGFNLPQAGTDYRINGGCGASLDLDAFFARLPTNTMVRVFFGQDGTINTTDGSRDWRALDNIVRAAEASATQPLLVVGLTNQFGICDGGTFKGYDWLAGGFRHDADPIIGRVAYWDFLHESMARYGSAPSIVMWEPAGEPEASTCAGGVDCWGANLTCRPDATDALAVFFAAVAPVIRAGSPGRLIGSGAIGGGQCGWTGPTGAALERSEHIDVLSVHEYTDGAGLDPIGLTTVQRANEIGKPVLFGELGMSARADLPGCRDPAERATLLEQKMAVATSLGADGFLLWAYGNGSRICNTDMDDADPALRLVFGP